MKLTIKLIVLLCCATTLLCTNSLFAANKKAQKSNSPWNTKELFKTPTYTMGEPVSGVAEIVYQSQDYRGKAKSVFAYYSSPGILNGNSELDNNLPAVVCVHGGGGRAFEQWAKQWARRGYAAIAMDLRGFGAGGAVNGEEIENGFKEGESRKTPFFVSYEDQTEDWFYQAVGDVVVAHSLIRSLKGVDPTRTAVVGISWGGVITTLVSGLDSRYSVAVPIYGCGYLFETGSMAPQIKRAGAETQSRWNNLYDPSLYVGSAEIPMLFVNGTNDHHFYTNQWQKSIDLPKDSYQSMRIDLTHGHFPGWKPEEIYEFIGLHLKNGNYPPTPKFSTPICEGGKLSCIVDNIVEGSKAYLICTSSTMISHKAEWVKTEIDIVGDSITASIPNDCQQCFISVESPSGASYSSAITFLGSKE